ncbi:hypothetical protein L210DRAFT_3572276 [Boletus edulis BED1]|uniref:Uncharacterized protein n=1 Tax=Boletus edulis BED1 TaxID=1328754 RepID=A0AAD4G6I7_BOLED|nr:hypothetical protein L210DRAFT_3581327 [Boletus edulis BED1]KAF8421903.1 hypothetical protein L210DRAFT_3572276 [Boletus edulis BED1]
MPARPMTRRKRIDPGSTWSCHDHEHWMVSLVSITEGQGTLCGVPVLMERLLHTRKPSSWGL